MIDAAVWNGTHFCKWKEAVEVLVFISVLLEIISFVL